MQAIKYIVLIAALAVAVALGMQTVVSGVVFESDKLVASDPTDGDHFGDSVDVFGDLAVVGVPRDDTIIGSDRGSAYIYRWNSSTSVWDEEDYLIGPAGHGTYFGESVAAADNTVVIGQATGNTTVAAYVYQWNGIDWLLEATLTPSSISTINEFANVVDISGDTVVIGDWDNGTYKGAAYIYEMPVTGWADMSETTRITASDGAVGDAFGVSVGISGDTVVVGANGKPNYSYQGSAYVFERDTFGAWPEVAKLTASDPSTDKNLGQSVAISGTTVLAGAPGDSSYRGAAYVFEKPTGGWANGTESQKLLASDRAVNDSFGFQVDISGDAAVVTAPYDGGIIGSAYRLARSTEGWIELDKLVASDPAGNLFGFADVAIEGNVALVGVEYHDGEGAKRGAAYVYGEPSGATTPGDFDGDGICDGRDFLMWQINPSVGSLAEWEAGYGAVGPLSESRAAVPEPAAWAILMLGAMGISPRLRRMNLQTSKLADGGDTPRNHLHDRSKTHSRLEAVANVRHGLHVVVKHAQLVAERGDVLVDGLFGNRLLVGADRVGDRSAGEGMVVPARQIE